MGDVSVVDEFPVDFAAASVVVDLVRSHGFRLAAYERLCEDRPEGDVVFDGTARLTYERRRPDGAVDTVILDRWERRELQRSVDDARYDALFSCVADYDRVLYAPGPPRARRRRVR